MGTTHVGQLIRWVLAYTLLRCVVLVSITLLNLKAPLIDETLLKLMLVEFSAFIYTKQKIFYSTVEYGCQISDDEIWAIFVHWSIKPKSTHLC